MLFTLAVLTAAAEQDSEAASPVFYVIMAVGFGFVIYFSTRFANRKSRESLESASNGATEGYAAVIAPAPPFPEAISAARTLLAEPTPEPRITRYTRAVVRAGRQGLTISDKKNGTFLSIPAADIVSIIARPATIRPRGTFIPRNFPSASVTVRRGDAQVELALVPIVGMYDKVSPAEAVAFAAELNSRVQRREQPS
ncbi:MAG: hypothetical protein ACOH1T_07470 [Microbacteriaceae bacterium]